MTPPTQHVAIAALGPSAVATLTWLLRGKLHVTVVVKATFALVPEGRMSLVAPDPIAADERLDPSGQRLQAGSDLAPYLEQCGVVVTGHADLPPGFSSPHAMVRLTVVQDGQVRIDKQVLLDGTARVGPARSHVRIDGMGPLPRTSPLRSRLLGAADARRLQGSLLELPEGLDWSYFQAAPLDQRIPVLRGDEWIVLGGMIAQRPKLRTQLPEARGAARLYRQRLAAPRAGEPLSLRADTVHIDVDRRRCSVVWRGHAPVEVAELESLRLLAGVELPAQPIAWADPFAAGGAPAARAAPSGPALQPSVKASTLDGTNQLSPDEVARVLAAAATPFGAPRRPSEPGRSAAPAPLPAVAPRAAAAAPARPGGVRELLEETTALDPEEAARAIASASTPFGARRAPIAASAEPPRQAASSSASPSPPAPLSPSPPALLSPAPLVAPWAPAAPPIVHPPGPVDASALPEGLGAQFLAAMADAGLLHG